MEILLPDKAASCYGFPCYFCRRAGYMTMLAKLFATSLRAHAASGARTFTSATFRSTSSAARLAAPMPA